MRNRISRLRAVSDAPPTPVAEAVPPALLAALAAFSSQPIPTEVDGAQAFQWPARGGRRVRAVLKPWVCGAKRGFLRIETVDPAGVVLETVYLEACAGIAFTADAAVEAVKAALSRANDCDWVLGRQEERR